MKHNKSFFIVCMIYLCGLTAFAGISGTYAKYYGSHEIKLQLSSNPGEESVIFLPYDGAELVTCMLPETGYYLIQLYDKGQGEMCTAGYTYMENSAALEVYYTGDGRIQIRQNGRQIREILQTDRKEDWQPSLFPYQEAPESGTAAGYCIISYLGDEMPEAVPELKNDEAEILDKQPETEVNDSNIPEETETEAVDDETEMETEVQETVEDSNMKTETAEEEEEPPETMQ